MWGNNCSRPTEKGKEIVADLFLSSFFFRVWRPSVSTPSFFPIHFGPQKDRRRGALLSAFHFRFFSLTHLLSYTFYCFVIVRAVQTVCIGIHHACICSNLIITLPIHKVADCRCFKKQKEHDGIFYSHLCEIDCRALPFPFVTCACMQPHRHITDKHTHARISRFFAVGKQLIFISPPLPPPCNNRRR